MNKVGIDKISVASPQQSNADERQGSLDRRYSVTTAQGVQTREVITDYFKEYIWLQFKS